MVSLAILKCCMKVQNGNNLFISEQYMYYNKVTALSGKDHQARSAGFSQRWEKSMHKDHNLKCFTAFLVSSTQIGCPKLGISTLWPFEDEKSGCWSWRTDVSWFNNFDSIVWEKARERSKEDCQLEEMTKVALVDIVSRCHLCSDIWCRIKMVTQNFTFQM